MIEIRKARSDADIAAVTALAWSFVAFLRERYPERLEMIDDYLRDQDFEGQLADFRSWFNPPKGECFLGLADGLPCGIVMMKPEKPGVAEMNRMFVAPEGRGHGLGRALADALIAEARARGHRELRLSALARHHEALGLYRSLGFIDDPTPPDWGAGDPLVLNFRMYLTEDRRAPT